MERTVLEGILKADPTGFLIQHPWVNNQLERVLARWAFKVCTAGGFEMPAFALADDGYLFLHGGKVYSGSDWMPQDRSINSLATNRGLVVRYPVRMKEDLLPYTKIPTSELRQLLARELDRQGCSEKDTLAEVESRDADRTRGHVHFALENRGQEWGRLRFRLCLRGGRRPLPEVCGASLQLQRQRRGRENQGKEGSLAVVEPSAGGRRRDGKSDRLNHRPDDSMHSGWPGRSSSRTGRATATRPRSTETRRNTRPGKDPLHPGAIKETPAAQWLRAKKVRSVKDLPEHFECPPSDRIGPMYNLVRKELTDFFTNRMPVGQFRGLVQGYEFTQAMVEECRRLNKVWGITIQAGIAGRGAAGGQVRQARKRSSGKRGQRTKAEAAAYTLSSSGGYDRVRPAVAGRDPGTDLAGADWAGAQARESHGMVAGAAHGGLRHESRTGSGALPFYAFPNELLKAIVERTGGRPVNWRCRKCARAIVEIDEEGRCFLVETVTGENGQSYTKATFLLAVTQDGQVVYDGGRVQWVHPFPYASGTGEDSQRETPGSRDAATAPGSHAEESHITSGLGTGPRQSAGVLAIRARRKQHESACHDNRAGRPRSGGPEDRNA